MSAENTLHSERFLNEPGLRLGARGFLEDAGRVERTDSGGVVLYHYTRREHVDRIMKAGGGLWARLPVVDERVPPAFDGCYLVEAFLNPLPNWVHASFYFRDLAREMMREFVGDVLLRIELPEDFPGLYVADFGFSLECKHVTRRGKPVLNLGYDYRTGHEVCRAEVNSYVPLREYAGGHIAPNAKIVRQGEGIAVPNKFITVCSDSPLLALPPV